MKNINTYITEKFRVSKDYKDPIQEISSMIASIYDNYVWTDETNNYASTVVKFTTDGTKPFNDIYKILKNIIKSFKNTPLAKCDMWYIDEYNFSSITIAQDVKRNITQCMNIYIDKANYGKTFLTCIYDANGPHIKQDRGSHDSSKHFKIPFAVMYEIQEKFNIPHV